GSAPQSSFWGAAPRAPTRADPSDCAPAANDDERLAPRLDCVENVGEVPGRFRRGHVFHTIRLSDRRTANVQPHPRAVARGGGGFETAAPTCRDDQGVGSSNGGG